MIAVCREKVVCLEIIFSKDRDNPQAREGQSQPDLWGKLTALALTSALTPLALAYALALALAEPRYIQVGNGVDS